METGQTCRGLAWNTTAPGRKSFSRTLARQAIRGTILPFYFRNYAAASPF